ncbi:MAG: lysophospholipid acyltransferase family protein [Spirochaetales bacterium]
MAYRRGEPLIKRTPLFLATSKALTWLVELIGWLLMKAIYGYRAKGRENLPGREASFRNAENPQGRRPVIFVSNHALPLDPLLHALSILPRFTYFTLLEDTVLTPVLGTFVRLLGGIPIPPDADRLDDIEAAVKAALDGRGRVHFYPEGECFLLNQEIKAFKAGAFYYAVRQGAVVVPIVTVLRRGGVVSASGGNARYSGRVRAEILILPALEPPAASGRASADLHAAILFARQTRAAMQAAIDAAGGDKSLYLGPMPRIKGVNDRQR